jgi:hypothetical protein
MVKKLSLTFFLLTVVSAGIFSQGVSDSVSPGISDEGNWLVIVNAHFPKWDKNLPRFHPKIR